MNSSRVLEQHNLLGGSDVVALIGRGRKKVRKVVHVDEKAKVGFAAALALVVEYGRKARETMEMPKRKRCPHCGRLGLTGEDFGTRVIRGQRKPQSWCRDCRAAKESHSGRVGLPEQEALLF